MMNPARLWAYCKSLGFVTHLNAYFGNLVNRTLFEVNGFVKFEGSATYWDDLRSPATAINPQGAPGAMGFDQDKIGFTATASGTTVIAVIQQIPHGWKEGSLIEPHIHWEPQSTNAGNVKWQLNYKWTNRGDVESGSWATLTSTSAAAGVIGTEQMSSFGFIAGTGKTISSILTLKISRLGDDAADTFTGVALLKEFDIHVEFDTMGSRLITSK